MGGDSVNGALRELLRIKLENFSEVRRFIVGYSGGADSHALLYALSSLDLPQEILALHVNHGLSANADNWQRHCESVCAALHIPFCAERANVARNNGGLENAARQARYDIFAHHVGSGDVLLLAHHADDQLETFFLRLLRGAGVRGLGGMPEWRAIGDGCIYRPWLECARDEIREYAHSQDLVWVEDESNVDMQFDRNYLREKVLPVLQARWPKAGSSIARSMSWCGEADAVADELAEIDYFACYPHAERLGFSLSFAYLRALSRARRRNVLRLWFTRCGIISPGHRILDAILDQVIDARIDASPLVSWADWQCRRYQGRVYVMPQLVPLASERVWDCDVKEGVADESFGALSFVSAESRGVRLDRDKPLNIVFAREGLRCRPQGRMHSQSLKKLFQESGIPPWLRERTPLIYQGDQLLAVGDWWICADAAVAEGELGYLPQWQLPEY
ncbi:MAG TPA: tRNA lysidine(34) synthetase TilS [Pseudomonadales bacterium]|nr:tRNA lysidine(34) synthetase TilS [Pseudomonadales bacterium]